MTGGMGRAIKGMGVMYPPVRIGVMLSNLSTRYRSQLENALRWTQTRKYLPAPRFVPGSASG